MESKLKTGMWKGVRCFVVGGGPSLKDFDFDCLKSEYTIAINRSFEKLPDSDCFITMDNRFYSWIKSGSLGKRALFLWQHYGGARFIIDTQPEKKRKYPDCHVLNYLGNNGMPKTLEKGLYSGANSGYAGLQLAIVLGANPIILLGFDMDTNSIGDTHYHDPYPYKGKYSYPNFIKYFEAIAPLLKKKGIDVININDSKTCGLQCFDFGTLDIEVRKPKKKKWKLISFYTPDYKEDYERLKQSIDKFGIDSDIRKVSKRDNSRLEWKVTTLLKAQAIYKAMMKHRRHNIVWVDCDAAIRQYPALFDVFKYDIGVYYKPRQDGTKELLSGTIFFRNNAAVRDLVAKWIMLNKENNLLDKSDQLNLQKVIDDSRKLKVECLPASYTQIFDLMKNEGKPVIEHFQASRRFKNK